MNAWKRLRLLLSGARRLTWLYRDPIECVQEPEDRGRRQPGPGPVRPHRIPLPPSSPGFTDASTTLQGLLLRCPVMRSFRNGFSPSATRAWRAGQRVVSTRCPTSGLSRLSPNWAWGQRKAWLATAGQVLGRPFTSLQINSPSEPSSEQPQNAR